MILDPQLEPFADEANTGAGAASIEGGRSLNNAPYLWAVSRRRDGGFHQPAAPADWSSLSRHYVAISTL